MSYNGAQVREVIVVKSKVGESLKQKLFLVYFKDGYIKPVIAVTTDEVRKVIEDGHEKSLSDIEKIVLEQNYYPQNEDYDDV